MPSYQVHKCPIQCVPNNYFKLSLGHRLIAIFQFRDNLPLAIREAYKLAVDERNHIKAQQSDDWAFSPLNPFADRPERHLTIRPYRKTSYMQRSRFPELY